jgi:hypothetical protein
MEKKVNHNHKAQEKLRYFVHMLNECSKAFYTNRQNAYSKYLSN